MDRGVGNNVVSVADAFVCLWVIVRVGRIEVTHQLSLTHRGIVCAHLDSFATTMGT